MCIYSITPSRAKCDTRIFKRGKTFNFKFFLLKWLPQSVLLFTHSCNWKGHPHKKECLGYDTKLHLMLRLHFWRSGEFGLPNNCYYSHIHSDPDWYDGSNRSVWKISNMNTLYYITVQKILKKQPHKKCKYNLYNKRGSTTFILKITQEGLTYR